MSYDLRPFSKNSKIIYLDLDGVLTDFDTHYENFAYRYSSHNNMPNHKMINALKNKDDLIYYYLDKFGKDFWETMPWTSYGRDLYNFCRELAPTIILTSPSNHPTSSYGKHAWLNKHIKNRDWIITGAKWLLANKNSLLIDDNRKKTTKFIEMGGNAILFSINELPNIKDYIRDFINY